MKLGLENIRALLKFVGNPEQKFKSVHVAGTNGKGSTCSMIASIATAAGLKTGLYTSPHLVNFNERIRINGKEISDERIVEYTDQLKQKIQELNATFFEATTAIAFRYFADEKVDVGVIETGLGGRLDATNVLTPLLSIITNIGLEHTEHLGSTIQQIAWEKGGIIKPNVNCLTATEDLEALRVLQKIAQEKKVNLFQVSDVCNYAIVRKEEEGIVFDVRTKENHYPDLFVGLCGEHQSKNAQLALFAAEYLNNQKYLPLTRTSIYEGLKEVRKNTGLRGRLEVFSTRPDLMLDVAHNPDGVRVLKNALQDYTYAKLILVFGVMKDKDYRQMIAELAPVADEVIAVQPQMERALDSETICDKFRQFGRKSINAEKVDQGVTKALKMASVEDMVLITGSHYVVGEVISYLEHRGEKQQNT